MLSISTHAATPWEDDYEYKDKDDKVYTKDNKNTENDAENQDNDKVGWCRLTALDHARIIEYNIHLRGPRRKHGAPSCTLTRLSVTGARAKAWCLLIHADASLSESKTSNM